MSKKDKKYIGKYIIIGLVAFSLIGGMVYKAMNPAQYKHPIHRSK